MTNDQITMRIVVVGMILVALACIVMGGVLILSDKSFPDSMIALGASAVTALGLVITRPMGGTQDVRVVDEPVEVEHADT